jgi:glyoxylate reductase
LLKPRRVYITRDVVGPAIPMISSECDIILNTKSRPPTRGELLKDVRGVNAILCMLSDKIDAEVMDAAGSGLKVISSYSTGVDHIDVQEANRRGIFVTFTGNILTEATADLAFALILASARLINQGDYIVKHKLWKGRGWDPKLLLGTEVHGATLGILGLGRIGSAVARRGRGFGMNVIYNSSESRNLELEQSLGAEYVDLEELMSRCDFLSINCTLNSKSFHIINEINLKKMKPSAYIINTARGQIISERDLIKALKLGWIAGAGLDVFELEPPSPNNPLLKMKNVVLLPHIGSATVATRVRMSEVTAKDLLSVLNGKYPTYVVNRHLLGLKEPGTIND